MIDFSIQAAGGEAGTPASRAHIRTWMKHLSAFVHSTDFVHSVPVPDFCSALPEATIAATLANEGTEYVIYLADKRELEEPGRGELISGDVGFVLPDGTYHLRTYSPASGQYVSPLAHVHGGAVTVRVEPFVEDLVIHITAAH
jgi:hypothetical protein